MAVYPKRTLPVQVAPGTRSPSFLWVSAVLRVDGGVVGAIP